MELRLVVLLIEVLGLKRGLAGGAVVGGCLGVAHAVWECNSSN